MGIKDNDHLLPPKMPMGKAKRTVVNAYGKASNVDVDQVEKLAAIGCSEEEIASFFSVSRDTLHEKFSLHIEIGRLNGKMSLRRQMWQKALGGNVTLMIWLSKQILGFTEPKVRVINEKGEAVLEDIQINIVMPHNNRETIPENNP